LPLRLRRPSAIVCAVDFSTPSARGLRFAAALARARGGRLHAVHIVDPLLSAAAAAAYDSRVLERDAMRDLARFVRASRRAGAVPDVRTFVGVGKAGAEIVAYARRHRATLIVMGTAGRRGVPKLFFGSTTEAVLRRFRGAVLVIPPKCRGPV